MPTDQQRQHTYFKYILQKIKTNIVQTVLF